LSTKGDRDWLIDVDKFESDRKRICRLSEIEPVSRKAASALRKSGIGFGDVVQIVLPGSAHYYFPVFGAWMLGAAVSLSDPGKILLRFLLKIQDRLSV
jgi:acyl-coenzyme A synthetase/AMP-(fatty) acid ligase